MQLIYFFKKVLDADSRAIQQISFTGKEKAFVMIYYILEQSKETTLQFSKGKSIVATYKCLSTIK